MHSAIPCHMIIPFSGETLMSCASTSELTRLRCINKYPGSETINCSNKKRNSGTTCHSMNQGYGNLWTRRLLTSWFHRHMAPEDISSRSYCMACPWLDYTTWPSTMGFSMRMCWPIPSASSACILCRRLSCESEFERPSHCCCSVRSRI